MIILSIPVIHFHLLLDSLTAQTLCLTHLTVT
jgi:hypothetical protein